MVGRLQDGGHAFYSLCSAQRGVWERTLLDRAASLMHSVPLV